MLDAKQRSRMGKPNLKDRKLSDEDVIEIRRLRHDRGHTYGFIASVFNWVDKKRSMKLRMALHTKMSPRY